MLRALQNWCVDSPDVLAGLDVWGDASMRFHASVVLCRLEYS